MLYDVYKSSLTLSGPRITPFMIHVRYMILGPVLLFTIISFNYLL